MFLDSAKHVRAVFCYYSLPIVNTALTTSQIVCALYFHCPQKLYTASANDKERLEREVSL